jgi:hypothetical protein
MTRHSRQTVPNAVRGRGVRFAYRHFGKSDGAPLVFKNAFTGTVDVPIQKDTGHD